MSYNQYVNNIGSELGFDWAFSRRMRKGKGNHINTLHRNKSSKLHFGVGAEKTNMLEDA